MKLTLDTDAGTLCVEDANGVDMMSLYSDRAFKVLSKQWVNVGWVQKHCYTFSWMGRPIIQLPDDMIRIQEMICRLKPDVIIETGVAHGGSLIYYASIAKAMDLPTRIVGVDIEIRPHNREAIEAHPLFDRITLIEGGSTEKSTLTQVGKHVKKKDTVLVILDSDHSRDHVLAELRAYSKWVSRDSYIVSTDGVMQQLARLPRAGADWDENNPVAANEIFVEENPDFVIEEPEWPFNESTLDFRVTHWPKCWLRRIA
ncbi:MAG: cephalosporin hydroxylase family protein [Neomegalonema sp.]|nr:cephalosporin hydroxylase family protein [Neomegalonema sp.]